MLSKSEIDSFIEHGFIKIEEAFSSELAAQAREILWKDLPCDRHDPSTWTSPVIRLDYYTQEPFVQAINTPALHQAFDQLVGKGRWFPRDRVGTFPVRFPNDKKANDTGWHADASFAGDDGSWRINVTSTGRALLMLFLFSDIGIDDAPTRILVGSHLDIPMILQPYGEKGLSFIELAQKLTTTLDRDVVMATGEAGTVYLCHPFLIHAAQDNLIGSPRFLAQPPLMPAEPININRVDEAYSPVEIAIRNSLIVNS
jgi:hypothetical protein